MNKIKCFFCQSVASIQRKTLHKNINGKKITLSEAPVYYCEKCKEYFQSIEAQEAFRFIKESNMIDKGLLFNYDDVAGKIKRMK